MGILNKILINSLIALLACVLSAPVGTSWAKPGAAKIPLTTGSLIRDYARITFEWPETVNFTAEADQKTLIVKFDRKANPDFGSLLSTLYPYVTSVQRKSDGKTLIITLDKSYKIRTFLTNNIGGIDILGIDPTRRTSQKHGIEDKILADAGTLAPSAGKDQVDPSLAATTGDSAAIPSEAAMAKAQAVAAGELKINVSASDDAATLRLPFTERMAIAAFIRNGYLWVVMNKPIPLNLADFKALPKSVIGKAEMMPNKQATILRIPVNDGTRASVAKEENSFEWAILLNNTPRAIPSPLKININTDPPAPPHVFIPTLQMGDPVTVSDPIIGDDLVAVPLYTLGEAVPFTREFVEFTLLESAQGVVVAKKADAISVVTLRNGLRIALPQGATLTPGLPEVEKSSTTQALQNVATLFPYHQWKLNPDISRGKQLREMFQNIVSAKNASEANDHRLRMAQVYLGEGLAPEAIGMLEGINRTDPVFYRSAKLSALQGAANFLMGRYSDALKNFSATELNNNKEMNYWRNMLADLSGKLGQYDYMDLDPDYISKYPPLFRQRLAIVAGDRAVDTKEYNTALKIFDTLHHEKNGGDKTLIEPIKPYMNFLLAKIAVDTEQLQEGLGSWNQLAEDYNHPFVQARAEFSRVIWQMNHNALTRQQVIERLERLRLAWHGDPLELKILTLLGDLYSEQKDYTNAMRIWDNGVNVFPNTPQSIEMAHRMEETFILMFNEGSADSMSPLDALSLYYQYKNYSPPGSTGRDMIEHLADRLVKIDLLQQAASLLEHQMRFEAEKVQRSQLGAKIATIHLLAHEPKRALQALEDSVYGENPAILRQLRNRLAAQALFDLGDPDKSWLILGQDDSVDAERIRMNIYWERRDWSRVISSIETILKTRKDAAAPITLDESEYVLKLALAYIFENNTAQLQYLHDYFKPLMADNPNKDIFEFITASDIAPTPTNFDDFIKKLGDTRSFISSYRARIDTEGLKSVVPSGSAK